VIPAAVATITVPDESKPASPLDAIDPDKLRDEPRNLDESRI
jgi:hypothetical protein